jgi:Ca2+-binding EF-hand superfamily protein
VQNESRKERAALFVAATMVGLALVASFGSRSASASVSEPDTQAPTSSCIECHDGIEEMHPEADLTCIDCHGGNDSARLKNEAHVPKPRYRGPSEDERVPALDRNLTWARFQNPMDLRIVARTCANCHGTEVEHLYASLHGTTAGHLSDGFYEMGLLKERGSKYGVFPVAKAPEEGGEVESIVQIGGFQSHLAADQLASHYTDLPRKECLQCHLWSAGRAVRGRVGFDGDYRGSGCAACHVAYASDGLSESGDPHIPRNEPGHARRHVMSRNAPTETCTSCHYGDASIGLHFRGLSQLPPDAPGGPEIPGTTDTQLNRVFYLNDASICPPDVHHERGMHCVDCHTKSDVMGDGKLHGQMEYAVEISCQACHGTFDDPSTLMTDRGTPLEHLRREGKRVVMTSKVSGVEHVVPQVVHVLDPEMPEFNSKAALAMVPEHRNIECYTCHAGWNVNFLGFHFSRIEQLTQLDLISGRRTPGRVTTQEKVFATWKSFYAGRNETGSIAPYLTGFSTMGSVWDKNGELTLDQVMPETAEGLSGMTMVHHQLHSTRPTARSCVECHRTSTTWGMGSGNFLLGRQLAFVADRRGVEVVGIDRAEPGRSVPLTKIPVPDVVDLAVHTDSLQGHAHHLYAAEGGHGIHVIDVSDPMHPRKVKFVATINPRNLELVGNLLYLADGVGGIRIFDASKPEQLHQLGAIPTFDAHDIDVRWPWAYVADGPGGLAIIDVRAPIAPRFLTAIDLNGDVTTPNEAILVESLFQNSRPVAVKDRPRDRRIPARNIATVLDRNRGPFVVDVTEPTRPEVLFPSKVFLKRSRTRDDQSWRGLALRTQVDPAEAQGGEKTGERDYVYALREVGPQGNRRSAILLFDISDPLRVKRPPRRSNVPAGYATEQLTAADYYNPPFRQRILFTPGERGVYLTDASNSREPTQVGILPGLDDAYVVALEEFPLDRMIDESGAPLKDISHEGSRWLYRTEIERLMDVSAEVLGTDLTYEASVEMGATARMHLSQLDKDHSGMLTGDEFGPAGGAGVDADGDGRITMIEMAEKIGLMREIGVTSSNDEGAMKSDAPLAVGRVQEDGDLARLLDGVDPFSHDHDGDDRLDRKELGNAFFSALDIDGDSKLTRDELSRYPGEMRQLRYGDEIADALFRSLDRQRNGLITRREFKVADAEWLALDADQDGGVRLLAGYWDFQRIRGFVRPGSEWPIRRQVLYTLPPGISSERLLAVFDADGDAEIQQNEMKARPELFQLMDRNRDGKLDLPEIERIAGTVARGGVDALSDDFMGRWDLDQSGAIEESELPRVVRLRLADSLR